jgi:flavin-dependent dehydrogenase
MLSHDYDVLVIGAGPAGSSAATRTAAAGLKTLVVEKETFPRFRIGESLLPHGNRLLRETGVWPKIEAAGFIPKFGASFHLADGSADKEVIFSNGLIAGLDHTFQVERAKFDALLLDHAHETGAEVRTATTVVNVTSDTDGHRVSLAAADGARSETTARWIIDSSGRDQFFPSELKRAFDPSPFPKRIAIYNHFTGIPRASGLAAGHTVVVRLPDGWFWIIPIDAQRTSVGLVTTIEAMRQARLQPAELFEQAVAASSKLRELMAGAIATLSFHVTSDYSYFRPRLATGRLVLTGDAGGFFDPIFSSGVYMACHSAKSAAELIVRAHRDNRPLTTRECQRYTKEFKSHAGVFAKLITAFYDNASFSVLMCPRPPLGLAPTITSIVAGHSRLTWPMWWRFKIFLLVCRLQHHLPLVPDLRIAGTLAPQHPTTP